MAQQWQIITEHGVCLQQDSVRISKTKSATMLIRYHVIESVSKINDLNKGYIIKHNN